MSAPRSIVRSFGVRMILLGILGTFLGLYLSRAAVWSACDEIADAERLKQSTNNVSNRFHGEGQ